MSLAQKLALAGGAGAAITGIVAPQSADAVPIQSTTLPLSPPVLSQPPTGYTTPWDVDNDGTSDFDLYNQNSREASLTELGAARFVRPGSGVNLAKLTAGFDVGPTMTGAFFFGGSAESFTVTNQGAIETDIAAQGWTLGEIGYFGFKFTNSSGVHYGWGQMSITGTPEGQGFTFTEAYYEGVAGAAIAVGDTGSGAVPEIDPASAGSVLSLVMGSLAMLERRRLRRAADASTATVSA
jgi:hypothetical protein